VPTIDAGRHEPPLYRSVESKRRGRGQSAAVRRKPQISLVFRSIETSGKPWAAAINGLALGGAFELTLSCHYRVAADNPKPGLACRKSRSGLFPRRRRHSACAAHRAAAGCDAVAAEGRGHQSRQGQGAEADRRGGAGGRPHQGAKDWIKGGDKAVAPWDDKAFKLPGGLVYSKAGMMMFPAGNAIFRRETYDNYPRRAPSCNASTRLAAADRCRPARRIALFHADPAQQGSRCDDPQPVPVDAGIEQGARRPQNVPPTKVKKLAIIGAGFMGASVGYVSARAGIDVVLIDRDQESADKGKGHAKSVIDDLIKKGRAKEADRDASCRAYRRPPTTMTLKDCDLIIEAVFEDRKVKAEPMPRRSAFET